MKQTVPTHPERLRVFGLHLRLMMIVAGVCLVGIAMTFFAFRVIVGHITEQLGGRYAGRYALSNRALLQEPLTREITMVRRMADSPVIREWARQEANPERRRNALAELESFRKQLTAGTWFQVIHSSLNYYYDDPSRRYGDKKYAYTLSTNLANDAWYFATIESVPEYALNVNYDRALDTRKVWVNAVIREEDGSPLGMIGTGFELTSFLATFVDRTEPGVENIILDSRLAIQAHRNRDLIDLQSVAKTETQHSSIEPLLTGPGDFQRLKDALETLQNGHSASAGQAATTLSVTLEGQQKMIGVAYLAKLDWYILTALDLNTVIRQPIFRPVVGAAIILTVILLGGVGWMIRRMILNPLAIITSAASCMSQGNYDVAGLPVTREDEIGTLARTFAQMCETISDHTRFLETSVARRTAELESTNRTLTENVARLEETRTHVRTLKSMLPICCSCKKIRDDKGYWNQLEKYIQDNTNTEFSHGLCPDCMKKLYPDMVESEDGKPKMQNETV